MKVKLIELFILNKVMELLKTRKNEYDARFNSGRIIETIVENYLEVKYEVYYL
jgi:hypothetical protein